MYIIMIALVRKCYRPREAIVQLAGTTVSLWILSTCPLTSWSLRSSRKASGWRRRVSHIARKKLLWNMEEEQFSLRRMFQFVVLLCIQLWPVPRFDREMLCSTTRASHAGVWAAWLIALSGKAARYMYKSLGDRNSAKWYVDKIMCT